MTENAGSGYTFWFANPFRFSMISATEALARLREGNRRFATGEPRQNVNISHSKRAELALEQRPFAIVLGCSDSRVPAEIVFDQGLGDLFVIRVAGNIVAPSQIGSIEFAAAQFGTRLVVVLGHSRCGAVQATIEELRRPKTGRSPNLHSIVSRIRPSVEELLNAGEHNKNDEALLHHAVRANVRASVNQLRHGSKILEELVTHEGLTMIGAEYSLDSGVVDFFE